MSTHYRINIERQEGDKVWTAYVVREHHTSGTESIAWQDQDADITALAVRAMSFFTGNRANEVFDNPCFSCVECQRQEDQSCQR